MKMMKSVAQISRKRGLYTNCIFPECKWGYVESPMYQVLQQMLLLLWKISEVSYRSC
jgi:hypothetical protein